MQAEITRFPSNDRQSPAPPSLAEAAGSAAASSSGPTTAEAAARIRLGMASKMHPLFLDLAKLISGRCLIQGSTNAGKSRTLRHLVEQVHRLVTVHLVDPEGEFGNLAEFIGATTILGDRVGEEALAGIAARSRQHRLPVHLDLSDMEPEDRIRKSAAFFGGLMAAPREYWPSTAIVAIDEAHLLAPHVASTARDGEVRRQGVAALTDLCSRGRKRGLCPIVSTQRLAKLASSVVSELHNFLIGINVFDRDIARAADLLGLTYDKASLLRDLPPGHFFAFGPALATLPIGVHIDAPITEHAGKTPDLAPPSWATPAEARAPRRRRRSTGTFRPPGRSRRQHPRAGPVPARSPRPLGCGDRESARRHLAERDQHRSVRRASRVVGR
ncbi:DUF87 domain-containing protein [Rhizorhabdus sp.]|uniref:helicase HerA domain-containing protein n=1 Tax=Rhizorhabdus sp. TaxID=1968843 RepID=UPI0025ECE661|nr:DUF87 domain-containing protein [Rhizorhabdus sp.]